jgi:two-component system response regulator NreC
MAPMKTIKTLLADDHTIVREGLRALLLADKGIEVVGEAHNGREAVEMTEALKPGRRRHGHRDAAPQRP